MRGDGKAMLTVFIGFDQRESVAWHVCAHSIMRRATRPVFIAPLMLSQLGQSFTRVRDPSQSTDFTYSRFLTPYLSPTNVSVFMDGDMLCLTDICELETIALANMNADVLVVKHDYVPKTRKKFLGATQTAYPCKNWSSLMVFNGHRIPVRSLTPDYVNHASAMDLHQFKWAKSVGELPVEWNHLVGEYAENVSAKIVHYTLGIPAFKAYETCEYSSEWFQEFEEMTHYDSTMQTPRLVGAN